MGVEVSGDESPLTRVIKRPKSGLFDLGTLIGDWRVVAMGLNQGQIDPQWGLAQGDNYLELVREGDARRYWKRGALCKCMEANCPNPHFDQRAVR